MPQKERDEQQQTLSAKSQHIKELETHFTSMTEELERERQIVLSLQKVGVSYQFRFSFHSVIVINVHTAESTPSFYLSLSLTHTYAKERDEQQTKLVATTWQMEELEKQVKSGNEELEMEKQRLLSVQAVGMKLRNMQTSPPLLFSLTYINFCMCD